MPQQFLDRAHLLHRPIRQPVAFFAEVIEPKIVGMLHQADEQRGVLSVDDSLHRGGQMQGVPGVPHLLRVVQVRLIEIRQVEFVDQRHGRRIATGGRHAHERKEHDCRGKSGAPALHGWRRMSWRLGFTPR